MPDPKQKKYDVTYLKMAQEWGNLSYCERRKVGALIVKNNRIISGEANMTSYLQAWHTWQDNRLRVVMGTYYDKVRFKQNIGWQIYEMHLEHTSTDHRMVGKTFD